MGFLDGGNVLALAAERESLLPYLVPAADEEGRRAQLERWSRDLEAGRRFDPLHARFLWGEHPPEFEQALGALTAERPGYAPLRFLLEEKAFLDRTEPALVSAADLDVRGPGGAPARLRISAVRQFVGRGRVLVSFVDNGRREIYGQRYLSGRYEQLEAEASRYVAAMLADLRAAASSSRPDEAEVRTALRREASRAVGRLPR